MLQMRHRIVAGILSIACYACTHSFELQTIIVDQAGTPVADALLSVPALGLETHADSIGRVSIKGRASGGCRVAKVAWVGYSPIFWTFDPAVPATHRVNHTVIEAGTWDETPAGLIDGCDFPIDSLLTLAVYGIDTVFVLSR